MHFFLVGANNKHCGRITKYPFSVIGFFYCYADVAKHFSRIMGHSSLIIPDCRITAWDFPFSSNKSKYCLKSLDKQNITMWQYSEEFHAS